MEDGSSVSVLRSSHLRHNAESQHRQPLFYHARRGDRLPGFVVEEGFSGAAGSVQGTETSQSGTCAVIGRSRGPRATAFGKAPQGEKSPSPFFSAFVDTLLGGRRTIKAAGIPLYSLQVTIENWSRRRSSLLPKIKLCRLDRIRRRLLRCLILCGFVAFAPSLALGV